ncbi:unnamed protein product, partial [Ixodes hexagonus]
QVFYNSRRARHPQAPVFQGAPAYRHSSSSGAGTSQDVATTATTTASAHNPAQQSRLQKVMMKSSVVVLSVAFLMLLGVACVVIANRRERLAGLVDAALSPCDNFYEYACATWAEEHPVPRGAERVSYRSNLVDYVEKRLDEIVRGKTIQLAISAEFSSSRYFSPASTPSLCWGLHAEAFLPPNPDVLSSLSLSLSLSLRPSDFETPYTASNLPRAPIRTGLTRRVRKLQELCMFDYRRYSRFTFKTNVSNHFKHSLRAISETLAKAGDNVRFAALMGCLVLSNDDQNDVPCKACILNSINGNSLARFRDGPISFDQVVVYTKKRNRTSALCRRTIINYLGLKALLVFSPLLPPNTEGGIAGLYGRLLTGRSPQQLPRWRLCLRAAEDAMPFAFLGMYHDVFVKEHNVLQLRSSLSKMKDLLGSSMEDITWLSSRDTPKALNKLKRVDFVEFFPGWVMSEEERNVFYESVRDVPVGNLLRSVMSAKSAHIDNRFRRLLYSPKHVGWFGSVFDVHVTYDPQNNTLYVPMAMFAEPMGFDSAETPLYIPRVLADVAHKLMGVVTGLGSLYDVDNGVGRWWTLGTTDAYANYSRCLSRQYNASMDFGKITKVRA